MSFVVLPQRDDPARNNPCYPYRQGVASILPALSLICIEVLFALRFVERLFEQANIVSLGISIAVAPVPPRDHVFETQPVAPFTCIHVACSPPR